MLVCCIAASNTTGPTAIVGRILRKPRTAPTNADRPLPLCGILRRDRLPAMWAIIYGLAHELYRLDVAIPCAGLCHVVPQLAHAFQLRHAPLTDPTRLHSTSPLSVNMAAIPANRIRMAAQPH